MPQYLATQNCTQKHQNDLVNRFIKNKLTGKYKMSTLEIAKRSTEHLVIPDNSRHPETLITPC